MIGRYACYAKNLVQSVPVWVETARVRSMLRFLGYDSYILVYKNYFRRYNFPHFVKSETFNDMLQLIYMD